jgi:hypothetical protein
MRAHGDGVNFQNIAATTAAFPLDGGCYALDVIATWNSGSVTLQRQGPDGATFITATTALSADGSSGAVALPKGIYRLLVTSATAVFASVLPIPGE